MAQESILSTVRGRKKTSLRGSQTPKDVCLRQPAQKVEGLHMLSKEMWYGVVIGAIAGAILSIPFQLATGLLFPSVQGWFDARLKARAFAKSKRMRKEYEEARYFVTYPDKMTHYFLNRGLEVLRLSVFLLVAFFGLNYVPSKPLPGIWEVMPLGAAIVYMILVISQSVNELHEIYYRVEFWGEYKKKVALELPDVATSG